MPTKLISLKKLDNIERVYDFQLTSDTWTERVDVEKAFALSLSRQESLGKIRSKLSQLKNIQSLSLSELHYIPDEIQHFKQLQILDIYRIYADQIPDVFASFPHLKILKIRGHSKTIESLPPSFYAQSFKIQELYLSNFKYLDIEKIVASNTSLKILNLSKGGISHIPESIQKFSQLRYLYIEENRLQEFPKAILALPKLESLSLAGNQIPEVPDGIEQLTMLKHLNLNSNTLKKVSVKVFSKRLKIKELKINNAHLKQIVAKEEESLVDSESLESVQLAYNHLEEFPTFLLARLPRLQSLRLTGNQIHSFPKAEILFKRIREIFLGENKITQFPLTLMQGLKSIHFLHLTSNQIKSLPKNIFQLARQKKSRILLENNQIEHIEADLKKHLSTKSNSGHKIELAGNPVLERLKSDQKASNQAQRAEQEEKKTCVKIGDNEYRGSGVKVSEHPLNNRISFLSKCQSCSSSGILITYASFSVHLYSGDVYWDYTYTCQNCQAEHSRSYAEND